MLVHVKRDELLAIAAQTAKAAPKTATSEAVLGIHVEADSRRSMLTLTATNYEIVIRASMGASVEQSGSVVISAALFPAAIGRTAWYMEQDDLTLGEKNAQFLKLFHEEDQRAVEDWICRNRAEEPYAP